MTKRIATAMVVLVVIAGLMLTAHMVVNQLNLVDVIKTMHGG